MNAVPCPHCGQPHQPGATFCPQTGRPIQAPPGAQQPGSYPQAPQPGQAQPPYGQPPQYGQAPPQGQYGQPPPYGQAPPQGQYGQPPPYGQAPPQGQYGQPPPYGQAPPQGQYGQPPPYGQAPPQGQYGQPPPYGQAPPQAQYGQQAGYTPPGFGSPPQASGFGAGKSVGTILTEAFQLYQRNLVALLVTCAILIAPISLAKSAAIALMMAPTAVVQVASNATAATAERLQKSAAEWQREMQAAKGDPKKLAELSAERQKELQRDLRDVGNVVATEGALVGGLMAWLLGLLAIVVGIALMYGIAIPLVTGALTIIIADRATGGNAGPGQAYGLLLKRLGKFLSAWIPAFFIVAIGLCLLVIPGLIAGFLFTFVAPVVLLESVGGTAALKRSVSLVKANAGQVFVVGLVFFVIRITSQIITGLFIPRTAFFVDSLVQDALLMLLLPIPIIGTVLLYLDIRRQADGLDDQAIRAGIEGLRKG